MRRASSSDNPVGFTLFLELSVTHSIPQRLSVVISLLLVPLMSAFRTLPDAKHLAGEYVLESVDGHRLPFTEQAEDSFKVELTSALMSFDQMGHWSQVFTGTSVRSGTSVLETKNESGSYIIGGEEIRLTPRVGDAKLVGTLGPKNLTIDANGVVLVYVRR